MERPRTSADASRTTTSTPRASAEERRARGAAGSRTPAGSRRRSTTARRISKPTIAEEVAKATFYTFKKKLVGSGWRERMFVLGQSCLLGHWVLVEQTDSGKVYHTHNLANAKVGTCLPGADVRPPREVASCTSVIQIVLEGGAKTVLLCTPEEEMKREWLRTLADAVGVELTEAGLPLDKQPAQFLPRYPGLFILLGQVDNPLQAKSHPKRALTSKQITGVKINKEKTNMVLSEFTSADENNMFRKLFGLPMEEHLLGVWPCALRSQIVLHGWMFLSESFLCFYSEALLGKISILVPVIKIRSLNLANDLFSQGLHVEAMMSGTLERYFFVEFESRKTTYKVLQAYLREVDKSGATPRYARGMSITTRAAAGSQELLFEAEKEIDISPAMLDDYLKGPGAKGRKSLFQYLCASGTQELGVVNMMSQGERQVLRRMSRHPVQVHKDVHNLPVSKDFSAEDTVPLKKHVVEDTLPTNLSDCFSLFFSDSSTFLKSFLESSMCYDIVIGEWKQSSSCREGEAKRFVTFSTPIKTSVPLAPKKSKVEETFHAVVSPCRNTLVVKTTTVMLNILGGNTFHTHSRWIISACGENIIRFNVSMEFEFLRKAPFKGVITGQGLTDYRKKTKNWIAVAKTLINASSEASMTKEKRRASVSLVYPTRG